MSSWYGAIQWLRQLRRLHARNLEQEAIRLGFVHRRAGHYISEETLERFREQKKRSRRMLSRMIAINEEEQAFSVAE
ncbi:MAG: replication endonuclease, partial [Sulfuricella sp.]